MRLISGLALALMAFLAGAGGGSPARAQFFDAPRYYRVEPPPVYQPRRAVPPGYQPAPGGGYYYYPPQPVPQPRRRSVEPRGYYPGMRVQPEPQAPGSSLRRLFGMDEDAPAQVAPALRKPRPRPAPVIAKQEKPKVETEAFVMVFGDTMADRAGQGLAESFAEAPEVEVVRKTRGDGGLVRTDVTDWTKLIQETLGGVEKPAVAVMMIGSNDRQPIREGDVSHELLSDRWRALYGERVDAVVRAFQERGAPFVWISAPPMRNERFSADIIAMNEIYRDRVQRGGGTYIDIWPGFVDDENRYTDRGPDMAGQSKSLRAGDGVNFTRAGARKVAFFADSEIKRLIEAKRSGTAVAALPPANAANPPAGAAAPALGAPPAPAAGNAALPPAPEAANPAPVAPVAPAVPAKPAAGPVVPLTRPEVTPGGTLVSGRPRLEGEAAQALQKTLRNGVPPVPPPGRADDFRWPPS